MRFGSAVSQGSELEMRRVPRVFPDGVGVAVVSRLAGLCARWAAGLIGRMRQGRQIESGFQRCSQFPESGLAWRPSMPRRTRLKPVFDCSQTMACLH